MIHSRFIVQLSAVLSFILALGISGQPLLYSQEFSPLERDYYETITGKPNSYPAYSVWLTENFLSLQELVDFAKEDLDQLLELNNQQTQELLALTKRAEAELSEKQRDPKFAQLSREQSNRVFAEITSKYRKEIDEILLPHQRLIVAETRRLNRFRALGIWASLAVLAKESELEISPRRMSELRSGLTEKLKALQSKRQTAFSEAIKELSAMDSSAKQSENGDMNTEAKRAFAEKTFSPALEILIAQTKADANKMVKPQDDIFVNLRFQYGFDLWGEMTLTQSDNSGSQEYVIASALQNRSNGFNESLHVELMQQREAPEGKWGKRRAQFAQESTKFQQEFLSGKISLSELSRLVNESFRKLESDLWSFDQEVLLPHQLEQARLTALGMELQLHGPFHFAKTYLSNDETAERMDQAQKELQTKLAKLQREFHREISEFLLKELNGKQKKAFEEAFGKLSPDRKDHLIGELHFSPRDFVIPEMQEHSLNTTVQ